MTGSAPVSSNQVDKVLVVHDDARTRLLAREVLERAGFQVETTGVGSEAVSLFVQCRPDLVLLDLVMSDNDGAAVYRSIRSHARGGRGSYYTDG